MKPLIERLPPELHYENSPEMSGIQNGLGSAAGDAWDARDGFAAQLCPATATWGLPAWEAALKLTPENGATVEERRSDVTAKLRGFGTATPAMLEGVAKALAGGDAEVLEYADEYTLEIVLHGITELSDELRNKLTATLKKVIPAHLAWTYGEGVGAAAYMGAAYLGGQITDAAAAVRY